MLSSTVAANQVALVCRLQQIVIEKKTHESLCPPEGDIKSSNLMLDAGQISSIQIMSNFDKDQIVTARQTGQSMYGCVAADQTGCFC